MWVWVWPALVPKRHFKTFKTETKRSEPWLGTQRTCYNTQRTCYNINILSFGAHLESVSLRLAYSCACSELPKLTCLTVLSLTIKKAQKSQKHKVKGQVWIGLDGTSAFQCKSCTSFLLRWMKLNNTTDKKDVPKCSKPVRLIEASVIYFHLIPKQYCFISCHR